MPTIPCPAPRCYRGRTIDWYTPDAPRCQECGGTGTIEQENPMATEDSTARLVTDLKRRHAELKVSYDTLALRLTAVVNEREELARDNAALIQAGSEQAQIRDRLAAALLACRGRVHRPSYCSPSEAADFDAIEIGFALLDAPLADDGENELAVRFTGGY